MESSLQKSIYKKCDLYILSTPYHILIAIGLILENKNDAHIILTSLDDESLSYFSSIKNKLTNLEKVKGVEIIQQKKNVTRLLDYKVNSHLIINTKYESVFIFSWNLHYAYSNSNKYINYFYYNKVKIILVEDGKKMYAAKRKNILFNAIAKVLKINIFPQKLYKIDTVMVTEPEKFPEKYKNKLKRMDYKIFEKQFVRNRNVILDIFVDNDSLEKILTTSNRLKTISIVFTQPLYKDGIIKSEEAQKIIYENLITKYEGTSDYLIVKKHPRDNMNYNFGTKIIEWDGMFPSELLNLLDIKFKNSIGINSSAIEGVNAENYHYNDLRSLYV